MSGLFYEVGLCTDTGRKRVNNEDNMISVLPEDPQVMAWKGALLIVADGLGGHDKGEVASEMVVNEVSKLYYEDDESNDAPSSLLKAIQQANASVYNGSIAGGMSERVMGTTCIVALLLGERAYIANVGDSRAYLVRVGKIRQVSLDHSWVAEQVRAGILTPEQARGHIQRNVITRCMGAHLPGCRGGCVRGDSATGRYAGALLRRTLEYGERRGDRRYCAKGRPARERNASGGAGE